MPDLLIELFSEEIPARMQRKAADDLRRLVTDALVEAGLTYEGAKAFATPRRLALAVNGLPVASAATHEERKGPRVGAPDKAVEGFLRAAGLSSIEQAKVQKDPKGDFYLAVIDRPGRAAIGIIAEAMPQIIRSFPWPKSMRWGERSGKPGSLNWVRPLHSILATFGPETEEPEIVAFEVDGIVSGDVTRGHRFMAPDAIRVRRFDDYAPKLAAAKVVLDADRRKDMILADARNAALALGLELVEDEGLLEEVAGLVEWPVVLAGSFDPAFLEVPPEAIRTTIRANQKCFVLRERGSDNLAPKFLLVANIEPSDGGKAIVAGNERVIRARLSDARFFWQTDLATPLSERVKKLDAITFHEKLGTQGERVTRIRKLAREIAPLVGADADKAERAALLAKADLVTEMVGEFPELQGLMGKYYALKQGEDASVAAAIEDHYKPLGPSDRVPSDPVAIAVALADKLDMLVGFWAIDEKPTGSKDPYALRRAALGIVRLILDNGLRLHLLRLVALWIRERRDFEFKDESFVSIGDPDSGFQVVSGGDEDEGRVRSWFLLDFCVDGRDKLAAVANADDEALLRMFVGLSTDFRSRLSNLKAHPEPVAPNLLSFFADRLKVQLREQGARHDLVDAVFALEDQDDLLLVVRRVEALGAFLDAEDGKSLLAGYRRAANIIRDEEKKSGETVSGEVDPALLQEPEEKALFEAIGGASGAAHAAIEVEDFAGAMTALAKLRAPVDAFFDKVLVNAPEAKVRANRLRLLNLIRAATLQVADFSRIGG